MRKFLLIIFCVVSVSAFAQSPYTNTIDPNNGKGRILNGIITKYIFLNDTATFPWYLANQKGYTPDAGIVQRLSTAKGKVKYIIFGGSWCGDTKFILPKFFLLQEAAGVPDTDISFFGVDRTKKIIGNLSTAFGITNVPTIIVMKDGKEVGRIVEYGKTGKWDKELAEML